MKKGRIRYVVVLLMVVIVGVGAMAQTANAMPTYQVAQDVGFDQANNSFFATYDITVYGDNGSDNLEKITIMQGLNDNLTADSFMFYDNTSGNSVFNVEVYDDHTVIDVLVNYGGNDLIFGITSELGDNQIFKGFKDIDMFGMSDEGYSVTGLNDFNNGVPLEISMPDYATVPAGDVNKDGQVDMCDLLTIATNWLIPDADYSDGDLSGDGNVGLEDFAILAGHWLEGVE